MKNTAAIAKKPIILVVDDSPDNLALTRLMLKEFYTVKVANNGVDALKIASSPFPPELILLDVMMPVMDGYEVCRQLKSGIKTRDIPIIFLTASSGRLDEVYGFKLGAVDYISKPIYSQVLLARVAAHLANKRMGLLLASDNKLLQEDIEKKRAEIEMQQSLNAHVINSFVDTLARREDGYAGRMRTYVELLSEKLRSHPRFSLFLNKDENISLLCSVAPFHDAINTTKPDDILLSPEVLPSEKFVEMIQGSKVWLDLLLKIEHSFGKETPFIKLAKEVVCSHHERWDGRGYPNKLQDNEIPVSARIIALADTYEALRATKEGGLNLPHEKIVSYIKKENGGKFDPAVVYTFIDLQSKFKEDANKSLM